MKRPEVNVSNLQTWVSVDHESIRGWIERVLMRSGRAAAQISLALVDDAWIHALNRRFLGHDWATDVITFPLSEPGEEPLAGEIVVSAEMAARVAAESGDDPARELALYIVHGLLHLCGCEDSTPAGAAQMRLREAECLTWIGFDDPAAPDRDPARGVVSCQT